MRIYILIVALLFTFCTFNVKAQEDYITNRQMTPQAHQFARFGNIPAKTFVGELDFSIPLYLYEDRDFKIPITLQYAGSGFMPNKREGIIGLDWFLNVGGCITRKVEGGLADEGNSGNNINAYGLFYAIKSGVYNYPNKSFNDFIRDSEVPDIGNAKDPSRENPGPPNPNIPLWELDYQGLFGHKNKNVKLPGELGPDIFNFSMPGHSGKFNITWDGSIQCGNNAQYKVQLGDNWYNTNPESIIIIDPDGYKYLFGGTKESVESSKSYPNENNLNFSVENTAWYLRKIEAPNGRSIEFVYRSNTNSSSSDPGEAFLEAKILKKQLTKLAKHKNDYHLLLSYDPVDDSYYRDEKDLDWKAVTYGIEILQAVYLDKILVDGNTVIQFNYKPKGRSFYKNNILGYNHDEKKTLILSDINIQNDNISVKNILFNQEFLGKSDENGEYRLFLKKLDLGGSEKYQFEYYDTDKIPEPLARGLDHWGFYNGGNILIPSFRSLRRSARTTSITSTSRDPNKDLINIGMLKRVIYPTGGASSFYYDQHDYSYSVVKTKNGEGVYKNGGPAINENIYGFNNLTAGPRIKKIEDYDDNGMITNEREFFYNFVLEEDTPEELKKYIRSSGILLHTPDYIKNIKMKTSPVYAQILIDCPTYPSGSDNYPSEKYIQYAQVFEKNGENGYNIYKYTSYLDEPDYCDYSIDSYAARDRMCVTGYDWWLKSIRGSDRAYRRGHLKELIILDKDRKLNYRENAEYQVLPASKNNYTRSIHSGVYLVNKYMIENFAYLPISKKQINYINAANDSIIKTTKYEYNNRSALSKEINVDNNLITSYIYPYDKTSAPYTNMTNLNILDPVVEQTILKGDTLLSKKIMEYAVFNEKNLYLRSKIYSVIANNNNKVLEAEFIKYDKFGNPVQITTKNGNSNIYLWGANGKNLMAEIKNVTYIDAKNALGGILPEDISLGAIPDTILISNLYNSKHLSNSMISTYSYKPLVGITKIVDPQNLSTHYTYDNNNRLMSIEDNNKRILSHYQYNLFPYPPLIADFNTDNQYLVNKLTFFRVLASGGTNKLEYNWIIKKTSGEIIFEKGYSTNYYIPYTFKFNDVGSVKTICNIKDINTGKITTRYQDFKVILEPMKADINISDIYLINSPTIFKANVTNGSGEFQFDWTLKDVTNNIILKEISNSGSEFPMTLSKAGKMQLICIIRDKRTGNSEKIVKDFTVKMMTIFVYPSQRPCVINQSSTFYADVRGGSNEYTYSWTIKMTATKEVVYKSSGYTSTNSCSVTLTKIGGFDLICSAKDVQSGIIEEEVFQFEAIPPLIQFKEENTVGTTAGGTPTAVTTAVIDCHAEISLKIELNSVFATQNGVVSYTITNGSTNILSKKYTDKSHIETISIVLPKGRSEFQIKIEKRSGLSKILGYVILKEIESETNMQIGMDRVLRSGL